MSLKLLLMLMILVTLHLVIEEKLFLMISLMLPVREKQDLKEMLNPSML